MATPEPARIRRAIESLGIPFDAKKIGIANMTKERQQTVLLGLLQAWTMAHLNNHLLTEDPLSPQERYMLNVSGVAEVTDGDAVSGLGLAMYLLIMGRDLIEEGGRNAEPGDSPRHAATPLIHATLGLIETWIAAMESEESFTIGTQKFGVVREAPMKDVLNEIMEAVKAIKLINGESEK